ncbi:MAG: class I tRNA ligase family protein, partial [Bacteroidota bacterium]
ADECLGEEVAAKKGRQPFRDVYFTGMVRDNKRRKMSKSLGNSPDALSLIENYGADGVRFGMLSSGSAGNDIIFDAPFDQATKAVLNESKLCEQGRNFCNKMWNALRLIKGWETAEISQPLANRLAAKWLEEKWNKILAEVEANFASYRLSDVLLSLYQFIWDDFCSWYLEIIKPAQNEPLDQATYDATIGFFEKMIVALHPFMPFVTEEIWHQLRLREAGEDCIVSSYPTGSSFDNAFIQQVERAKDVITKIRETRQNKGISQREPLRLFVEKTDNAEALFDTEGLEEMLLKMGSLSEIELTKDEPANAVNFISGTEKYYLEMEVEIDREAERDRLTKELEYFQGFVQSVMKKLDNERFVSGAPAQVVEGERKKLADGQEKIRLLEESLAKM